MPAQRKYPEELRERAVKMGLEIRDREGKGTGRDRPGGPPAGYPPGGVADGDTALSFSEVKALATGNPLLMDKAEADVALTRLQRAERAWHRNHAALEDAIAQHEDRIGVLTRKSADIDVAISRRQETRGAAFVMTIDGQDHRKRADAGEYLKDRLTCEIIELHGLRTRATPLGSFGGFRFAAGVERSMGKTTVTLSLDGVPDSAVQLSAADLHAADPSGLVTRIEKRLHRLEGRKQETLDGIAHARREITHARQSVGQPFPQAAQLADARDRAARIDEQLDQMVRDHRHEDAEPDQQSRLGTADSAPVARHAISAGPDWRDEVIRSGMDAWMPRPIRPFEADIQRSPERESPGIGD